MGEQPTIPGAVVVIAKTPIAGLVKTRLSPPFTPAEACQVAWACLFDTLDAAAAVRAERHVLLLSGPNDGWVPVGFEVIPQRGNGLAERLAAGFTDIADTAVVIAMDTPQVSTAMLTEALSALNTGHASVLGPAADGGYWLIGLARGVDPGPVFRNIPMSQPTTGQAQADRLNELGLRTRHLNELHDIDTLEDLTLVAAQHPATRVSRCVSDLRQTQRSGR